jgi:hypothetical protein
MYVDKLATTSNERVWGIGVFKSSELTDIQATQMSYWLPSMCINEIGENPRVSWWESGTLTNEHLT